MTHADMTTNLVLYSTSACHLCEEAERLLGPWVAAGLRIRVDDISDSDALFACYGLTIPVLKRCDTGAELNWPFDADAIARFVTGLSPL
jgi:hypothetical protein